MIAFLGLWSHAVAALVFAALTVWQARQRRARGSDAALVAALAAATFWALAVAGTAAGSVIAPIAESVRNLGLLAFMYAVLRDGGREDGSMALTSVYGVVAAVALLTIGVTLLGAQLAGSPIAGSIAVAGYALKLMVVTAALVLLHNLYASAGPAAGAGFRAAVFALATLWIYELNLYTVAYLGRAWPEDVAALRGLAAVAAATMLALAVHRADGWTLRLSRTMTFQTLSLAGIGFYLLAMVLMTSGIALIGGENARAIQAGFVFGTSAALLALLPNPKVRGWLKVKLAKHLFQHRYDYRAEWLRFTDTLGRPEEGSAPLAERVVKAIADITDSPDGLLFVPDGDALPLAARWNWPAERAAPNELSPALGEALLRSGRIVELDSLRRDDGDEPEAALVAQALLDDPRAWTLVPLLHLGRLAGVLVLGRPPIDRALDWEDFDLLRVAGRQVASYLAEAQGQQALDDARRFDAFNRRFAFIMHDVKNLVSQLSLVARNAERHADNPAFRADMIATLQESAERMNALLARLDQHNSSRVEPPQPVVVGELIARVVQAKRLIHPVVAGRAAACTMLADPQRLDKLLAHLVQNAIDASSPDTEVRIDVRDEDGEVAIDVVDHGCGMSPAFVREQLFSPFASTKPTGFGVGAYEARQLALAMGGRIEVASVEGEGSRFSVILPAAPVQHQTAHPDQKAA